MSVNQEGTQIEGEHADMLRDALSGLTSRPKSIPGKYLWDDIGSDLYDRICHYNDYYPSRQELSLLAAIKSDISDRIGPSATVVEFGSGASRKIRTLLDALIQPHTYVAIDISREYLNAAIQQLKFDYPAIQMIPVCADYTETVHVPLNLSGRAVLGFYPGPSIGNFRPDDARIFLEHARTTLGSSLFLIGTDGTRDAARLKQAYAGADGLMAAFHLNVLARLNRECDADFDVENFDHTIRLFRHPDRVEAHLVARASAEYHLGAQSIPFEAGDSILTDTSYKYTPEDFHALASSAGWKVREFWQDDIGSSCLHLLEC
ncbi:L-histidine N(alpha)-methyltransferase [Methylobacterium fujisawaense]|jgi:dimethylhistidine N-methyltransferase|uniref:L-histidine N(alpha)-methyltransferase n=1 Tax=Methylobacterium fujisawaense TaxID=107400 RepID=UPI0031F4B864